MNETRQALEEKLVGCSSGRPEDRRNSWVAAGVLLVWAASYAAATFLLSSDLVRGGLPSFSIAALPVALSLVTVAAYMRFILRADELLRKIQLEALAFGFGGGFVATFASALVEKAGVGRVDITTPWAAMIVCWVIGLLLARRRYA